MYSSPGVFEVLDWITPSPRSESGAASLSLRFEQAELLAVGTIFEKSIV